MKTTPEDVKAQKVESVARSVTPNGKRGYLLVKRIFDIVASALAMIVLSPIFLLTAIAIKLEDHGPAFYSNYWVGKGEKKFPIHKFRSMYVNAAEIDVSAHEQKDAAGITFKLANDPRVTKVGKFIRRACIDELPQLFNIFMGEMSFVGPRPLPPYAYAQLSPYDRNRYKVKGGLLCFWQISDRSKVSFEEWMDMDIRYVNEASVWTDFKILLMTVPAIFMTIWKNY